MTWQRDTVLVGAGAALMWLLKPRPRTARGGRPRYDPGAGAVTLEWAGYGDDEGDLEDQVDEGYKLVQDDVVFATVRRADYDLAAPWHLVPLGGHYAFEGSTPQEALDRFLEAAQ